MGIGPGAATTLEAEDVKVAREFYTLGGGAKMFYQLVEPVGREATHIVVFLHGYSSHSDLCIEPMAEQARRGAMVVLLDLPCHGHSDGLLMYIPDWWAWVGKIW